jgi:hypothetical protein
MTIKDKDMQKKDLNYFMGLNYDVIMRRVDDNYCAFIPELSLFVEDPSASDVFEKLEKEKAQYFKRAVAVDAGDTVREPLAVTIRNRFKEDILLFSAKTLAVGAIFGIIMMILLRSIDVFVSTRINPIKIMGVMITQIDDKLNSSSEKKQEAWRSKLRGMVQKIKPLVDEVRILFDDKNGIKLVPHTIRKEVSLNGEKDD